MRRLLLAGIAFVALGCVSHHASQSAPVPPAPDREADSARAAGLANAQRVAAATSAAALCPTIVVDGVVQPSKCTPAKKPEPTKCAPVYVVDGVVIGCGKPKGER